MRLMIKMRWWIIGVAPFLLGCSKTPQPPKVAPPAGSQADYLAGIVTAAPAETPAGLVEKQIKLESQLQLAQAAAGRGELDRAIKHLEAAVLLDPKHRTVLPLLTQYLQARSKELVAEDPGRSYRLMVQSGGYLRMLRGAYDDFSSEERKQIANVLFDEACAHARAKRQEETSGSLRAAIEAGFDDLARLESEPDFEPFRKIPTMAKMLAEAADMVRSRQAGGGEKQVGK
jgi:tetratricopeptide (TPR) repeat protein